MNCSVVSGAKQDRRVDKPGQSDIRSWEDALRTGSTRRGRPVCMNFNVDAKCCICVWTRHARTCLIKSDFVIFFGVLVFFKRDFYPWISLDCGRYHSTVERAKFIPVQAYQAHTVISRSHSNRSRENIDIPIQPYHAPRSIVQSCSFSVPRRASPQKYQCREPRFKLSRVFPWEQESIVGPVEKKNADSCHLL